ncbi:hypothetical protein C5C53_01700 [Rathayibacter sp. AY1E3]|nr:hypothetical protein C5C53_01700 [Rathayibacter sp. AY1E3]PPI26226.1 hypothetical protein C5D44_09100 [Rathayibacter sp. AY1B5]
MDRGPRLDRPGRLRLPRGPRLWRGRRSRRRRPRRRRPGRRRPGRRPRGVGRERRGIGRREGVGFHGRASLRRPPGCDPGRSTPARPRIGGHGGASRRWA